MLERLCAIGLGTALCLVGACGDDDSTPAGGDSGGTGSAGDGAGGGGLQTDLYGVYAIDSLLDNEDACENPDSPVLQPGTRLVLYPADRLGVPIIGGAYCGTVERCREIGNDSDTPGVAYGFDEGDDDSGWRMTAALPMEDGDGCSAEVHDHVMTTTDDGIRIDSEIRRVERYEPDANGLCRTQAAIDAAEGLPCSGVIELIATFEAAL